MATSDLKLMDRVVGTADGWDECDYLSMQFYGFVPAKGFDMPAGTLFVDLDKGVLETYSEEGSVIAHKDFMIVMNGLIAVQKRNS